MKHWIAIVPTLLIISGCEFTKKFDRVHIEDTNQIPAELMPSKKSKKPELCPATDNKKALLATWTMSNGFQFNVCDMDYSSTVAPDSFSGWINLFHNDKGKLVPAINESISTRPSAFQSFTIQKINDSEILVSRFVSSGDKKADGKKVRLTEKKISCQKKDSCDFFEDSCLDFKKDLPIDKDAIKTVEAVVSKKLEVQDAGDYDVVIGKVVVSAVAGDATAKKLILVTPAADLKVDGAAAETYHDGLILLSNLQVLKCI